MNDYMNIDRWTRVWRFLWEVGHDAARRNSLMEDPRKFLEEEGLSAPPDMDIQVHEDTQDVVHVVFPVDPNRMISDQVLTAVAAGSKTAGCTGTSGSACCSGQLPIALRPPGQD